MLCISNKDYVGVALLTATQDGGVLDISIKDGKRIGSITAGQDGGMIGLWAPAGRKQFETP